MQIAWTSVALNVNATETNYMKDTFGPHMLEMIAKNNKAASIILYRRYCRFLLKYARALQNFFAGIPIIEISEFFWSKSGRGRDFDKGLLLMENKFSKNT